MSNISSANQYTNDQREQLCWDFYLEELAKGIENAFDAAIKAGYSNDHARNITMQGWFKERKEGLIRQGMLAKAEENLGRILDTKWEKKKNKETETMRIVGDISFKIAKTLGKDKGYTERDELTGKNGESIPLTIVVQNFKSDGDSNPASL